MKLFKNFSQLYKNFKNIVHLFRINVYPVKSIYKSNLNFKKNNDIKDGLSNLVMSSNNRFVSKKRISDLNKINDSLNNFSCYFYSHKKRDEYMSSKWVNSEILEIYNKSIFQQMKADIFRYCFLYDNGGYWLDIKSNLFFNPNNYFPNECSTQLLISTNLITENIFTNKSKVLNNYTNNRMLTNWFIGARKNSPFLLKLLKNIIKDYPKHIGIQYPTPKRAILEFTGPIQLTKTYFEYDKKFEVVLLDELEHEIEHEAKYGRKLNLLDDIFYTHYSKAINSKIIS